MKLRLLRALPVLLLLAGLACHGNPPSTSVLVYNQSRDTLDIGGEGVSRGMSRQFFVANGETSYISMVRRGTRLGIAEIVSLVAAGDPNNYDAAINVHEDTLSRLRLTEYSPYIQVALESLP